ncbi:MAG: hypothetical protein LBN10_05225 [Propionibacteriaceae bacterium]|jgi:hypothetical protein|nr:hypothetical protein [Propionibacteriaceae bacterium]
MSVVLGTPGRLLFMAVDRSVTVDVGKRRLKVALSPIWLRLSEREYTKRRPKLWRVGPFYVGFWGRGVY